MCVLLGDDQVWFAGQRTSLAAQSGFGEGRDAGNGEDTVRAAARDRSILLPSVAAKVVAQYARLAGEFHRAAGTIARR